MDVSHGARRVAGAVLVADNAETIRMIVRGAPEAQECVAREAVNGREARALLTEEVADVIVLDMRMPVMDGRKFAEAYRAHRAHRVARGVSISDPLSHA